LLQDFYLVNEEIEVFRFFNREIFRFNFFHRIQRYQHISVLSLSFQQFLLHFSSFFVIGLVFIKDAFLNSLDF